jgi:hypothetical protein
MSDLRKKVEIERVRRLIFEIIQNLNEEEEKSSFEAVIEPPASLNLKIEEVNEQLRSFILQTALEIHEEEMAKDETLDKNAKAGLSSVPDEFKLDELKSESIKANQFSILTSLIDSIIRETKIDFNNNDSEGGGPLNNMSFSLNIPSLLSKEVSLQTGSYEKILETHLKSGSESSNAAIKTIIAEASKDIEREFKANIESGCDTIIQAIDSGELLSYLKRALSGKSKGNEGAGLGFIFSVVTGGLSEISNDENVARALGLPESFIKGMSKAVWIEGIDFFIEIAKNGSIFGGLLTYLRLLLSGQFTQSVVFLAGAAKGAALRLATYAAIWAPILIIVYIILNSSLRILSEGELFSRVIETYKNVMIKVTSLYFQSLSANFDAIVTELVYEETDFETVFEMLTQNSKGQNSMSVIEQEIKKALDNLDENEDIETGPLQTYLYYSQFGLTAQALYSILSNVEVDLNVLTRSPNTREELKDTAKKEEIKRAAREKLISDFEKDFNKNGDFLRDQEMSDFDVVANINHERFKRFCDHNEWYRKSNETKEGNLFSPREAQFLNDVLNMADVNVGQQDSPMYFSALVGNAATSLRQSLGIMVLSIVVSIKSDIKIAPASLRELDKKLFNIQDLVKNLEQNIANPPFNILYDIFEVYDFDQEVPKVQINKQIYMEILNSVGVELVKTIDMTSYEISDDPAHFFPLNVKTTNIK